MITQAVSANAGNIALECTPRRIPDHFRLVADRDFLSFVGNLKKRILDHKHQALTLAKSQKLTKRFRGRSVGDLLIISELRQICSRPEHRQDRFSYRYMERFDAMY